jgi:hypothetical protein
MEPGQQFNGEALHQELTKHMINVHQSLRNIGDDFEGFLGKDWYNSKDPYISRIATFHSHFMPPTLHFLGRAGELNDERNYKDAGHYLVAGANHFVQYADTLHIASPNSAITVAINHRAKSMGDHANKYLDIVKAMD